MGYPEMFRLKKPCANCPFKAKGAIDLEPGRLAGIVEQLRQDDWSTFSCHKSVHNPKTGGTWDDEGVYTPSGKEAMCAGAMLFLEQIGRPSVGMRIGQLMGLYDPARMTGNIRSDLANLSSDT